MSPSKRALLLTTLVVSGGSAFAFVPTRPFAPYHRDFAQSSDLHLRKFSAKPLFLSKKGSSAENSLLPLLSRETEATVGDQLSQFASQAEDALSPAAQVLNDATDGWALSYADLSPESESTPIGQAFLATNVAYACVGLLLSLQGEVFLGLLTELCSVASFVYHYTQLQAPTNRAQDSTVRLALMVDYVFAFSAILVGLGYLIMDQNLPPFEGVVSGAFGVACLLACWIWERGIPYIILHSLWHLFSAYCGFVVGNAHLMV